MKMEGKGGYLIMDNGEKIPIVSWSATPTKAPTPLPKPDKPGLKFAIGYMHPCHIGSLLSIEKQFPDPWKRRDFLAAIRDHQTVCKVAEINDQPVAYAVWGLEKQKLYLIRLAVHREVQRCSVGSAMLSDGTKRLSAERRPEAWTQVDERNLAAQLFLKSQGWIAVSVNQGWMRFVFREEWRE